MLGSTRYSTLFTWLHKAGAKKSFTYLTALLTPSKKKKIKEKKRFEENVGSWRMGRVGRTPHLCPCSGFCHCHGAPEPRRFQWRRRWGLQLWTDLRQKDFHRHPFMFDCNLTITLKAIYSPSTFKSAIINTSSCVWWLLRYHAHMKWTKCSWRGGMRDWVCSVERQGRCEFRESVA